MAFDFSHHLVAPIVLCSVADLRGATGGSCPPRRVVTGLVPLFWNFAPLLKNWLLIFLWRKSRLEMKIFVVKLDCDGGGNFNERLTCWDYFVHSNISRISMNSLVILSFSNDRNTNNLSLQWKQNDSFRKCRVLSQQFEPLWRSSEWKVLYFYKFTEICFQRQMK